jgi:hypothetical protein
MTWQERTKGIVVGSKVCYSKTFLRSTGQMTGDLPFSRGKVTEIKDHGGLVLATVHWNDPSVPAKVAVCNLSPVTEKGIMERD